MSGIAHLSSAPLSAAPPPSTVQPAPHPPPHPPHPPPRPPPQLHITVPVMPHPGPLWMDPASAVAVAAPQPIHYFPVAHTAPQLPPKQPTPSQDPPVPRPRKPYTATKVREMWSASEHQRMLEGLRLFKRDWAKVTEHVGTRSTAQVRSHAQKYFDKVAREKTDDYVPRARPKRKSATPYPRKVREHPPTSAHMPTATTVHPNTHTATSIPPAAATHPHPAHPQAYAIPVQQLHPAVAATHAVQPPTTIHPAPMHVQYAAPPSTFVPQLQPSSYVAQQQPQISIQQQPPTPTMFSPYLNICPTQSPNLQRSNFDSSVQPSPVSFVSGHAYTAQSPAPQPQHVPVAHSVFNLFSPLTPGAYASVARSPSMAHAPTSIVPIAQVQQPIAHHSHVHSHPEGPLPNCAKCNALRRYGGVLQEIVQFGGSQSIPAPQVAHSNQAVRWQPIHQTQQRSSKLEPDGNTTKLNQATDSTACATVQEQSDSTSGKKSVDDSLPSFKDSRKTGTMSPIPTKSRAHRSKLSKSKKIIAKRISVDHVNNNVSSGEMSESDNFSRINPLSTDISKPDRPGDSNLERKKKTKSSLLRSKKRKSCQSGSSGLPGKNNSDNFQRRSKKIKCVPIAPTPNVANNVAKRPRVESAPKPDQLLAPRISPAPETNEAYKTAEERDEDKTAMNNGSPAPNSPKLESESDIGSPRVETYSPKEQKEIFDAVHSLQILSRTPSSSSPSQSESKTDSENEN